MALVYTRGISWGTGLSKINPNANIWFERHRLGIHIHSWDFVSLFIGYLHFWKIVISIERFILVCIKLLCTIDREITNHIA